MALAPLPRPLKEVQHNSVHVAHLLCSQGIHGQREKLTPTDYLLH